MAELVEQEYVEKQLIRRRQVYVRTAKSGDPDLTRYERQHEVRTKELEAMLTYAEGQVSCLMQSLRAALGDGGAGRCGQCSRCGTNQFSTARASDNGASLWLSSRDVPIAASRRPPISPGLAVLNGDQRGHLFVQFMRQRAAPPPNNQLADELLERLEQTVLKLKKQHQFGAVIAIPTQTWQQRETTAHYLAGLLGIKAFPDLLAWREVPPARQGELLNNDQRRHNVKEKMHLTGPLIRPGAPPPKKGILLLDDYSGSGATIKEAVRVLRKEGGFTADIVPFTVARIRWRIGARGMI
jgi:ATP-dependent DNA helicase RecQ